MLVFSLENGARVIIRPSGTEPKNKIYLEVPAPPVDPPGNCEALARSKAETDAVAQQIADDFTRQMLAIIDVSLPDYALRLSSLLPLDRRLDFVAQFIPGFERRVQTWGQGKITQQEISQWIDAHLASYGKDARGLVRDALAAYLHAERQKARERSAAEASQRQQYLDAMETVFFAPAV
jgi:Phosphoglucomutase/phosphomannomutase, C-terminal domain